MIDISITNQAELMAFWLIFCRWGAILMQIPLFDSAMISMPIKMLSTLVITYAFYNGVMPLVMADIVFFGTSNIAFLTIAYMIIGLILGFFIRSIMLIFLSAGSVITQQIGFSAISYFDVTAAQRVGPFEKFLQAGMLIIVITSGALIPMFKGINNSFLYFQISKLSTFVMDWDYAMDFFKGIVNSTLFLAMPILFSGLVVTLVMGIIARTVPQMNILMVSFVINIGMGLITFCFISNEFFQAGFRIYTDLLGKWFQVVS